MENLQSFYPLIDIEKPENGVNSAASAFSNGSADHNETRFATENDIHEDGFFHLAPKTHDISFVDAHVSSIKHVAADLEAAVKAVWPRRHDIRYTQVYVLLLSWEDDDLGVASEIKDLCHVFEDMYQYEVETFGVPSLKPDKALKRHVLDFLEKDKADTLLVVYYAGHAKKNLQSNEAPIWLANRKPTSPSLPSSGIQSLLEEAESDVLLLLDCCHSAATTTTGAIQGNTGVTEVVAACGYETVAPEPDQHSFSKAVTEILAIASKGPPFSVGELHNRVLDRLRCWTPSLVKNEDGKFVENPNGRLALEPQPRRTPIYSILCETSPRRSIVLGPLRRPNSSSIDTYEDPSALPKVLAVPPNSDFSSANPFRQTKPPQDNNQPQIILAIRLETTEINVTAIRDCLRLLPPECKDIKIEGVYRSFSTLLLLRMPVAIWNLLPENAAYSFVGFVISENIAAGPVQTNASVSVISPASSHITSVLPQESTPAVSKAKTSFMHGSINKTRGTSVPVSPSVPIELRRTAELKEGLNIISPEAEEVPASKTYKKFEPRYKKTIIHYHDDGPATSASTPSRTRLLPNEPWPAPSVFGLQGISESNKLSEIREESPPSTSEPSSNASFLLSVLASPAEGSQSSSRPSSADGSESSASRRSRSTARTSLDDRIVLPQLPESIGDYFDSARSNLSKNIIHQIPASYRSGKGSIIQNRGGRYDPAEPRASQATSAERQREERKWRKTTQSSRSSMISRTMARSRKGKELE